MRHIVFRLEKDRYALPLSAIREVVAVPQRFSRVPRSPIYVRGIMNLRGRVVTADAMHCQRETARTIVEKGGTTC